MKEMHIIMSPQNWETRRADVAEELVVVPLGRGAFVRMRKSEAVARGLIEEEGRDSGIAATKGRRGARNKKRLPGEDKSG